MRVGELSEIPEKGIEQKRGEGKQRFKKGGKLGQGVGALKRGEGLEPPYELRLTTPTKKSLNTLVTSIDA